MLFYLLMGLNESRNIYVIIVIPKRIDGCPTKTQPGKVNEKLKTGNIQYTAYFFRNIYWVVINFTCTPGQTGT